jgi:hypothetical protein
MSDLHASLQPVLRRQRWRLVTHAAAWGCLAGGAVLFGLGVYRLLTDAIVGWPWFVAAALGGPVLGALVGAVRRLDWNGAARAVDATYLLKDRAVTALAFSSDGGSHPLRELQMADALSRLAGVDPKAVVPLRMPRVLPYGVAAVVLAALVCLWPGVSKEVQAGPSEPREEIVAEAEVVTEELQKLTEAAKQFENPELESLVKELEAKVAEMKEPGVDTKEALAKLSEMQQSVQSQMAAMSLTQMDAQLAAVGEALSAAEQLRPAGQAMSAGEHDKAAELLEKTEEPTLDAKESKAVAEKLKQLASSQGAQGSKSLKSTLEKLGEACSECNGSGMKDSLKKLAGECKGQGKKKKIADLLQSCCNCLSECKGNCQKNSTKKGKQRKKSTSPSSNFGMGESGNIDGERTDSNAGRNREQLTGLQGEGPSETETTHEVEGKEQSQRSYREQFQKYQRMSEAVLESEPIPLGHRQTIRKYFELIRPNHDEAKEAAGEAEPTKE